MSPDRAVLFRAINVMDNLRGFLQTAPGGEIFYDAVTQIMAEVRIMDRRRRTRFIGEKSARKKVLALAKELGINTEDRDPRESFGYDGKNIATGGARTASDILHDMCHYVVAPAKRRTLVEFGLGDGFDTGDDEAANNAMVVSQYRADQEELYASLLGILTERNLGMDWIASMRVQNWVNGEIGRAFKQVENIMNVLGGKGFLTAAGTPNLFGGPRVKIDRRIAEEIVMECVR